jgi:hypothetical protein
LLTDLQLKPGRSENFEAVGRHNLVEIELATSRRTSVTRSMSPRSHLALKLFPNRKIPRCNADRWRERSRLFPHIAAAMADQWGDFAVNQF